jgi:hypothetical protein
MIPDELKQRFNIRKTGSVRRGDYILAYGRPCYVANLKLVRDPVMPSPETDGNPDRCPKYTLNVMCYDIFTAEPICVQTHRSGETFLTFEVERREHIVLLIDLEGVLTDTEDELFADNRAIASRADCVPGTVLHTVAAPACLVRENGLRQWAANRATEKITKPAVPLDSEGALIFPSPLTDG